MPSSRMLPRFVVHLVEVVAILALWTSHLAASSVDTELDLSDMTDEQRLLKQLRHNYDAAVRPVFNAKNAVIINLGITLTQIIDVDEKNQVLTTNVWLDQNWIDEKLKWDVSDFANISILRIPCDLIWLPDIVLYNSVENHKGYMKSLAMVENNGNVFWPPIVRMRSSCKMDITYFPFDDQICILKLGSWAYDGNQVDVTNRTVDIDLSNYVDNGEWELIGTNIIRNVKYYPCCLEPFPDVIFYLHIRRRVLYYLLNVIIPCMLLSSLSLTGFLLPPDSGEKVTLGLTVLLAFSVFMLLVAENMPPTSEYIPLIGIYLTVIMAMSALSVALSVFVLNCHHRGSLMHRPPRLVRTMAQAVSKVLCMNLRYLPHGRAATSYLYSGSGGGGRLAFASSCPYDIAGGGSIHPPSSACVENGLTHEMGHVNVGGIGGGGGGSGGGGESHVRSNPLIDLGMNGLIGDSVVWTPRNSNIITTSTTTSSSTTTTTTANNNNAGRSQQQQQINNNNFFNEAGSGGGGGGGGGRGINNNSSSGGGGGGGGGGLFGDVGGRVGGGVGGDGVHTTRLENEVLYYLRAVLESHERSKTERVATNEWQEVARVLDKLFFWLFVAVTSISTLVLLVFSPMTKDVKMLKS